MPAGVVPVSVSRLACFVLAAVMAVAGLWHFVGECVAYSRGQLLDAPLYAEAAIRYWQGLPVYVRADDMLAQYKPGAMVFKFPPTYLFVWLPWFDASGQWPRYFQPVFMGVSAALYLLTVSLALQQVFRAAHALPSNSVLQRQPHATVLVGLVLAVACWFVPILYVFGATSAENLMACLAMLAFCVAPRWPRLAGVLLAYPAAMKLYPVFLLLYPLLSRQWSMLRAAVMSLLMFVALSVWVFGWDESRFYATHILPILLNEPAADDWTTFLHPAVGNLSLVPVMVGHSWLFPSRDMLWVNLVRLPMLITLCWALLVCVRPQDRWGQLLGFSVVIVTMLACLPNLFYPYFTWLVVPLIVLSAFSLYRRHGVLLLVALVCAGALLINDVWIQQLYQAAGLDNPSPAIVKQVEAAGPWLLLWHQYPLLGLLVTGGQLVPFTLYLLWLSLLYGLWRNRVASR